ncbi:hypothetical protein JXA88_02065 [Candidatus Fermentibacteria bacterium]|nr:hypothetical protein [Candidatus Fermentibacteria bacterium]
MPESHSQPASQAHSTTPSPPMKTIFGWNPFKVLFAMEYVLQGLANPFQGITYQSFFRHFRFTYGMSEAATQSFFSRSYLAWSFKPIIGFLMDAFGKTKVALILLLASGSVFYVLTPFFDTSAIVFFWLMFVLSIFFACTDVAVDRSTVITGDEESKSTGRSKAATVGLNQAICWAAIYGTSIIGGASGGWIADNIPIKYLLFGLAAVPLIVLLVVLRLPKDTAHSIPIKNSVRNFWDGLNTGPILWIVVFYFLFHFQPALGALWTNYLITSIHFSQTNIGYADGISYFGYFLGVLWFAKHGIKWQDRFGMKAVFRVFIILSICANLTQYALVEPWFSKITTTIHSVLPGTGSWSGEREYEQFPDIPEGFGARHYWLERIGIDGTTQTFGPLTVMSASADEAAASDPSMEESQEITAAMPADSGSAAIPSPVVGQIQAEFLQGQGLPLTVTVAPGAAQPDTVRWTTDGESGLYGFRLLRQVDGEDEPTSLTDWVIPGGRLGAVRWGYYAVYNFFMSIVISFIRMSTFSLVGAVIPVAAAGSLFAGFMSVANLAYSFSYASGSWLYDNGLNLGIFRTLQGTLFGIPSAPGDTMSIALLIFIGSMAYLLSFVAVRMLPDRRHTQAAEDAGDYLVGPEHFKVLGDRLLRWINRVTLVVAIALFAALVFVAGLDVIAGAIVSFFLATFMRKVYLDMRHTQYVRTHGPRARA